MNPRNFLIPTSLRAFGLHILRPMAVAIAGENFATRPPENKRKAASMGACRIF